MALFHKLALHLGGQGSAVRNFSLAPGWRLAALAFQPALEQDEWLDDGGVMNNISV